MLGKRITFPDPVSMGVSQTGRLGSLESGHSGLCPVLGWKEQQQPGVERRRESPGVWGDTHHEQTDVSVKVRERPSATPTHHPSLLTAPITAPGGWTSVGWAIPLRWQPSQSSVVFGPSARPHVYWCTALSPLPPSHSGWATLACSVRARAPCSCLETLVAARAELSHWQRVAPVVIALDRAQCELPVTFTILSDSRLAVCVKSPDSDWFVVTESVLWSGSSGYTWVLTVT